MSYLKYDSTIKVKDGYFCFRTMTQFRGVDWQAIEESGEIVDLALDSNVFVLDSNDQYLEVNKIKYYGLNQLTKIVFENDQELIVHKNQLLSKEMDLGDNPEFVKVRDLIVGNSISTRESSLKIKEIIVDFEESHVYSLVFDNPNQSAVHYIQFDIVVK